MNYVEIGEFGKYLVMRKEEVSKEAFFEAIKCKPTEKQSLQNNLYRFLCCSGSSVDYLYASYLKSCPKPSMSLVDFISVFFSVKTEIIEDFIASRKNDEKCFYVDITLINGYGGISLLGKERLDEECVSEFQSKLKEALKKI